MKKVFIQLESGRGYGRDILKGIYNYNNRFSEWEIIFEPSYYLKTSNNSNFIHLISEIKPDGCIIENYENAKKVIDLNIPLIQTSSLNSTHQIPCLKGNYDADGKMAFEYFLSKGFKNLAFFGIHKVIWSDGRLESLQKNAFSKNIKVHNYTPKKKRSISHDLKEIISWLKSLPKPIGIFCCNDDLGIILINACSMAKLKIPYEIAILGVDNDELLCSVVHPKLSSIARNHTVAAFNACEILNKMMLGINPENHIIPTEPINVIERSSTDTIASNDKEVIKALHFIRNNTQVNITVNDVVNSTNISRRNLYTRFKKTTNRTILEDIQFQKIKKFKVLLTNQKLSVKEIAFQLGFEDVSHISRWFSAIEGTTPVRWRKNNM
ncbi:DNA-binding transcriptional regulator [uncultured Polaribacter sp.]|uniref:DNA-binding transcriptional regulator n=1 Tax=uncultured Polaribacter sp. TaxID=174711 RepID=UPI00263030F4|nr:DNA-binding transcriptional regulator [uncultured Polaribacter sp.]